MKTKQASIRFDDYYDYLSAKYLLKAHGILFYTAMSSRAPHYIIVTKGQFAAGWDNDELPLPNRSRQKWT